MTHSTIIAIDLETTGLIPSEGQILEATCYELHKDTLDCLAMFHKVFDVDIDLTSMDEEVIKMHQENNLLYGKPNGTLYDLYSFLNNYDSIIFLGSSVHFDKAWIEYHLPEIKPKLHYRIIDTSSFTELFPQLKANLPSKPIIHRSTDDILYSITVARQVKNMLDFANKNLFWRD